MSNEFCYQRRRIGGHGFSSVNILPSFFLKFSKFQNLKILPGSFMIIRKRRHPSLSPSAKNDNVLLLNLAVLYFMLVTSNMTFQLSAASSNSAISLPLPVGWKNFLGEEIRDGPVDSKWSELVFNHSLSNERVCSSFLIMPFMKCRKGELIELCMDVVLSRSNLHSTLCL